MNTDGQPASADFLRNLPKAELHLHIEGTLEPPRMFELAERNGVHLPYANEDAVRAAYAFEDLQSFLDLYYLATDVLQTEADFYDLTMDYLNVCRQEHIIHTEMMFDPQAHTGRGLDFAVALHGITGAMQDAKRDWNQESRLIMCFMRHLPPASAMDTLQQALPHRHLLSAVGLDSSERGFPPEPFAEVFQAARAAGLKAVAHAGEEGPPAYIRGALDALKVDRIDHGIRAEEDPALVAELARRQVPLTVCPLSNVRLCAVPDIASHNILRLLDAGVPVTVNSDDPAYFGGYLTANFQALADELGMTESQARALSENAFAARF